MRISIRNFLTAEDTEIPIAQANVRGDRKDLTSAFSAQESLLGRILRELCGYKKIINFLTAEDTEISIAQANVRGGRKYLTSAYSVKESL